jgi:hypothetical protein
MASMADRFTDPGWWQHRPRHEQATSAPKLLVGTLLPALVIVGVVVMIVIQSTRPSASGRSDRSVVAFTVCMQAHGVSSSTKSGSPKQQLALGDCRDTLPRGAHVSNFSAGGSSQEQFDDCMRGAGRGRSGSPGRFGRGPSQGYLDSFTICRSLTQSGGPSETRTIPATPASTAPPVA